MRAIRVFRFTCSGLMTLLIQRYRYEMLHSAVLLIVLVNVSEAFLRRCSRKDVLGHEAEDRACSCWPFCLAAVRLDEDF